jgi:mRNA interferase MazF
MGVVAMTLPIQRFDVFLVCLDPTLGSKIQKTRPCLVVSPDEMNRHIATVIIAPMTSQGRPYPTRIACQFQGKAGQIVLDQLRTVDKMRLVKRLGCVTKVEQNAVLAGLAELFGE